MAGLGYANVYGLASLKDELLRLVAERKRDEALKQQFAQQEFENQRTLSRDAEQTRQFNETQDRMREAADANRDLNWNAQMGNRANQISDATAPGTVLAPPEAGESRALLPVPPGHDARLHLGVRLPAGRGVGLLFVRYLFRRDLKLRPLPGADGRADGLLLTYLRALCP